MPGPVTKGRTITNGVVPPLHGLGFILSNARALGLFATGVGTALTGRLLILEQLAAADPGALGCAELGSTLLVVVVEVVLLLVVVIDAVVVSTPDHTHAAPGITAMRLGKHCYCEKPLTHCVQEARLMAEVAAENKVATQMGTQHHARNSPRRVVELIRSGAIGPVRECHAWIGGSRGGGDRPKETPPVPPHLKWDLWLGPRPYRPYHPSYAPYKWRFWWDFGTGETGNNGVHTLDLPFWALKLRHPTTIAAKGPPVHSEGSPCWMHVEQRFRARDDMPPVTLHFYHTKDGPPVLARHGLPPSESGTLFVGKKGMLLAGFSSWKLYPEKDFADFRMPVPTISDSIGHHREWIHACKTGEATTCNFDYAGALTEMVLLGNVAYRVGKKLDWDPKSLKATNSPEADRFINETYRKGWTLYS